MLLDLSGNADLALNCEHLEILFRQFPPELLMQNMCLQHETRKRGDPLPFSASAIPTETYKCYAIDRIKHYTDEEQRVRAAHMQQQMHRDVASSDGPSSVFWLLARTAQMMLTQSGEPALLCRYEHLLKWQEITHLLGQDIFTAAYLAQQEWKIPGDCHGEPVRTDFSWPSILRTDNDRLYLAETSGIAENHFHLYGSTRMFQLSWACLTNHPLETIRQLQQSKTQIQLKENLVARYSYNEQDQQAGWEILLLNAAVLRAWLYKSLYEPIAPSDCAAQIREERAAKLFSMLQQSGENRSVFVSADVARELDQIVQTLRSDYGQRIPQPNRPCAVLDYAMRADTSGCPSQKAHHNRLLAGERSFLYECFRHSFRGEFSELEQDAFYLYLLLQNLFYKEMTQTNDRMGFYNFSRYQDRKRLFWGERPEYYAEAMRLALNNTIDESHQHIHSLEARIMSCADAVEQVNRIRQNDNLYAFAETARNLNAELIQEANIDNSPVFYVVHFPKRKDDKNRPHCKGSRDDMAEYSNHRYRHYKLRDDVRRQALALMTALEYSPYLRKRIRGIDACSNEIGCRPEVFAGAFRYLCKKPHNVQSVSSCNSQQTDNPIWLRATYHVGEDFLDITDGLRAIDEALMFLELARGSRLGHALALGTQAEAYYALKENCVLMPAQDLLDNLVWLSYRSLELGVDIPLSLREKLRQKEQVLFDKIYGSKPRRFNEHAERDILQDYYEAWHLRGDDPAQYRFLSLEETVAHLSESPPFGDPRRYDTYARTSCEGFVALRKKERVREIYRLYHYDNDVKKHGSAVEAWHIEPAEIKLISEMQAALQKHLAVQGIVVECNPTSNILIGAFRQYHEHPIFRFNHHGLAAPHLLQSLEIAELSVSVNTDDQGVFGTSLENEYAVLSACMKLRTDENGNRLYSDEQIYSYLRYLQELGQKQSFHPHAQEIFTPLYIQEQQKFWEAVRAHKANR